MEKIQDVGASAPEIVQEGTSCSFANTYLNIATDDSLCGAKTRVYVLFSPGVEMLLKRFFGDGDDEFEEMEKMEAPQEFKF